MNKIVLGLDLGTNSIGWALTQQNFAEKTGNILAAGSRIIPMPQDIMGKFDSGQSLSQTAERTSFRGIRRLRERHLLRRERLHRVLHLLGYLPSHYEDAIDFTQKLGQFKENLEPKLSQRYNNEINKYEFQFMNSFNEMVADFKKSYSILPSIPHNWTIYYLRKKALTKKIEKEELAWLLLHFNQKRGYHQLRGEEEVQENKLKTVEYHSLKVLAVEATDEKTKGETWYNVHLENGWTYRRTSSTKLDWVGLSKDFIVTTSFNEDGTVKLSKEGKEARNFKIPDDSDWTLLKKKTESQIKKSGKTVGEYIYQSLLSNSEKKIKGNLVKVVERNFYKDELIKILEVQSKFHPEFADANLYASCIEELYQYNEAHKNNIANKNLVHLFLNDIIFYQRPLKSKKSLIGTCRFEKRTFLNKGIKCPMGVKAVPKSHPLFQEFRLLQWVQNLKIKSITTDEDVTSLFFETNEDKLILFNWLLTKESITNRALLQQLCKPLKLKPKDYRWNYVYNATDDTKAYPCAETKAILIKALNKAGVDGSKFLTDEICLHLWHILYSVNDKRELKQAIKTFAAKHELNDDVVAVLIKLPPYPNDYAAYSLKAIKKLIPLMHFDNDKYTTSKEVNSRIEKILGAEFDETISDRVRQKLILFEKRNEFAQLPLWLASYVVYNRHSEEGEIKQWHAASEIEMLQQHSLRNPIVEQVINETLRVVRDLWLHYGKGEKGFFNAIHIELGREMKNPNAERERLSKQNNLNENTNLRIKALLTSLLNKEDVENVIPHSPSQQEIMKIYEDTVLQAEEGKLPDDILKISKLPSPSPKEMERYILWLQQKYKSPYTGAIIPLSKLFTRAYDIEHIIPQSRYYDNSFSNKVICETGVNKDKGNSLGLEYIKANYGKELDLGEGRQVKIFTVSAYQEFVEKTYGNNRGKLKRLLMDEIPDAFIQRQLNDSRYISNVVKNLLSNIVREDDEQETVSKHLISCNGSITNRLKQDWGLHHIWNDLITPRFEQMNANTNSNAFGEWMDKEGKRVFQIKMPLVNEKGFNKKRIDHRHHALDAIVIASASRNHINFLNNESALGKATAEEKMKKRHDLRNSLCFKKYNDDTKQHYSWQFHKPWSTFTQDSKAALEEIIISFKQNIRVINKTINHYQKYVKQADGTIQKKLVKQTKGDSWAIRKSLHQDTVAGPVSLQKTKEVSFKLALEAWQQIEDQMLRNKIKILLREGQNLETILNFFKDLNYEWEGKSHKKTPIYYYDEDIVAVRKPLDNSFNSKKIAEITDTGIQAILLAHLEQYNEESTSKNVEHPELAFSPEGIIKMNANITLLNNGKQHQPIFKVRLADVKGNKFSVGESKITQQKFVIAAKGTNLFFAIYSNSKGDRSYATIPLHEVIERQKQGLPSAPETNEQADQLLMVLSPNDLVYLPEPGEIAESAIVNIRDIKKLNPYRIYKVVSFTNNRCSFIQQYTAKAIVDKLEFGPLNKIEISADKLSIKKFCLLLKTNRIGQLVIS